MGTWLELAPWGLVLLLPLGWWLRGKVSYRKYAPEIAPIVKSGSFEFLREGADGVFASLVPPELIPEGEDPHGAVMERTKRDGVAYSARKVNGRWYDAP